jgi:hypothetical protein
LRIELADTQAALTDTNIANDIPVYSSIVRVHYER